MTSTSPGLLLEPWPHIDCGQVSSSAYFTGNFSSASDFTKDMQRVFILVGGGSRCNYFCRCECSLTSCAVARNVQALVETLPAVAPSPRVVNITGVEVVSDRRMRRTLSLSSTTTVVHYFIDVSREHPRAHARGRCFARKDTLPSISPFGYLQVASPSASSGTVLASVKSELKAAVNGGHLQTSIATIGGSLFASVALDASMTVYHLFRHAHRNADTQLQEAWPNSN